MRHSIPLFVHARQLRRSSTPEERMLWELVRGKQLGFKFRRQHPFPPFILESESRAAGACVAFSIDGEQLSELNGRLRLPLREERAGESATGQHINACGVSSTAAVWTNAERPYPARSGLRDAF